MAENLLEKYFSGVSEFVFHSRLGIADIELTDYVSTLLVRFTNTASLDKLRALNGKPTTELFAMMVEAQRRIGTAKRETHRHIGDFALFWSGLYPEALRQMNGSQHCDRFLDYCEQGKLAYEIASEIDGDEAAPPSNLLHRLSVQFDLCAYGLREIRRSWEEGSDGETALLI
jgi:hypothetical protein